MVTYEDEIEEVGEGVDRRDQEQGQQATQTYIHPPIVTEWNSRGRNEERFS
jgi:hypothetical protein